MEQHETVMWEAREHNHAHKDPDWFWGIGVTATAIAVISIFIGNPLFALLIVLGTATLFIHAIKNPHTITVVLNEEHITAENDTFPYEELDSFWVVQDENGYFLILKTKRILNPRIIIPLDVQKIEAMRKYLGEHIPEKKLEIPISHRVLDFLGL
ncbi:MAG: hypothetical protein Q8R36_00710 [bacterium]|nr:hypothetical protein [bacterium]